jgi:hypothetical protein
MRIAGFASDIFEEEGDTALTQRNPATPIIETNSIQFMNAHPLIAKGPRHHVKAECFTG